MAEEAVDPARLPVARIAGIDEDDFVEISRQPERGAKSGGPATYYCNIVSLCGHAEGGCKFDSLQQLPRAARALHNDP